MTACMTVFCNSKKRRSISRKKENSFFFFHDNKIVAKQKFYYWNSGISSKFELMVSLLCHLRFRFQFRNQRRDPLRWFRFRPKWYDPRLQCCLRRNWYQTPGCFRYQHLRYRKQHHYGWCYCYPKGRFQRRVQSD